jgi:ribosome biogenesis GTPase
MTKRRINQQQAARIKKNQAKFHSETQYSSSQHQEGLVLACYGRHAEIENDSGQRIHCDIRTNLNFLVAGDRVIWQEQKEGRGVVLSLCPRTSVLNRVGRYNTLKPVAANVDQLIIVLSAKPEPSFELLDSYLVMAECLHIQAAILLNKIDLPSASLQETLQTIYKPLGYPILYTSQIELQGYDALNVQLSHHLSVIVGQSGVGKSSLISHILPHEQNISTGAISEFSELGCHTTSNSRLYHLPEGGALIDSPGIRELNLWQMSGADVLYGFRELRDEAKACKFRNCDHKKGSGCAIIHAVEKGLISEKRYESYLKILSHSKS